AKERFGPVGSRTPVRVTEAPFANPRPRSSTRFRARGARSAERGTGVEEHRGSRGEEHPEKISTLSVEEKSTGRTRMVEAPESPAALSLTSPLVGSCPVWPPWRALLALKHTENDLADHHKNPSEA